MEKYNVYDCSIIELDRHHSDRKRNLSVVEKWYTMSFDVMRAYYLYNVHREESRAALTHKTFTQTIGEA